MAGENAARLMRDRAVQLARKYARGARREGQTYEADVLGELADEIAEFEIGGV